MKLFSKMGKAKKRWRRKAWLVNPNRTKIILVGIASKKRQHVPPWIYNKEPDPSFRDLFSISNIRKEYCGRSVSPALAKLRCLVTRSREIVCLSRNSAFFVVAFELFSLLTMG
jgi:hypothetical protein